MEQGIFFLSRIIVFITLSWLFVFISFFNFAEHLESFFVHLNWLRHNYNHITITIVTGYRIF
jgi:hypothetical protein